MGERGGSDASPWGWSVAGTPASLSLSPRLPLLCSVGRGWRAWLICISLPRLERSTGFLPMCLVHACSSAHTNTHTHTHAHTHTYARTHTQVYVQQLDLGVTSAPEIIGDSFSTYDCGYRQPPP